MGWTCYCRSLTAELCRRLVPPRPGPAGTTQNPSLLPQACLPRTESREATVKEADVVLSGGLGPWPDDG